MSELIQWATVQGSQDSRPESVDLTSSSRYVYLRRNIHQVTEEQESGETVSFWEYEEAKIRQEVYATYNNITAALLTLEMNDRAEAQDAVNQQLQAVGDMLTECVLEISEIIYGGDEQ